MIQLGRILAGFRLAEEEDQPFRLQDAVKRPQVSNKINLLLNLNSFTY